MKDLFQVRAVQNPSLCTVLSDFPAQTIPLDEIVANSVEGLSESMVQRESDIISQLHVAHPHVGVTADPSNTTAAILKKAYDDMKSAQAGTMEAREAAIFYGQLIAAYVSEATNRVIGIALSGASPGQQFGAYPNFLLCEGNFLTYFFINRYPPASVLKSKHRYIRRASSFFKAKRGKSDTMSVISFGPPADYERMLEARRKAHDLAVYKQSQHVKRAPIVPQPPWHPDSFERDPLVQGWTPDDGDFPVSSIPGR